MSKTITEIAQQLGTPRKFKNKKTTEVEVATQVPKVQLIYAFNGTGKTRLSRAFKELIAPKSDTEDAQSSELAQKKILYYSAFTEDLFYWDNDLNGDAEPKLKIQPNSFTKWVLDEQGQDQNITSTFQHYTNEKLTPHFSSDFSEVSFSFERGNNEHEPNIKISKGEESNFIWSVFHSLIEQMISELNIPEAANRSTDVFNNLEYVFVDDPVSSLDENHLIELAVNLASLIKSSQSDLKFIVTTHSPLFYNVLFNELNGKACYMLERFEDGTFALTEKHGDSNKSFSYHLYLKQTLEQAIIDNKVEKYHFTLLRNLYEKTASFLGYPKWSELLPDDKQLYLSRIINFTSHSTLSNETVAEPTQAERATVKLLLDHLKSNYGYWQQEQQNG
ncbi:anticodon nuclease [Metapseudomonas lalkuanensis]|uniref:anticodon nuclease n=1 Tax=Metapseudomonas lalkuanensis TaxID=2604832 RepID=UPI001CF4B725|nr:anticodon nuclease [Pseudomonas lalkuanensis]UCO97520.1 anticodon nuclease [Pseudomonas lalkuanensis]